ncbi:hypothetical protein TTHERM_00129220 (macronuclear) [Tetrahymena thermophila SB210]|uniref:Uncharacterized protein n=1 Tax=Tetrahymena thermophila (strain SB210) TaxID=312017 RepID=I7MED9_TETTS|nr:hypothetical protein TTHERM_00129220 [Tetrahymena thermophila SB210]EAR96149.1 hypothetical protein TTHERM_00129220 [Tetrahymena thermophila SB210]|eukprot:XP_001016394.1 hypothetical protein TTHERM_00129220 [Tetrahymena thermophila SB210]
MIALNFQYPESVIHFCDHSPSRFRCKFPLDSKKLNFLGAPGYQKKNIHFSSTSSIPSFDFGLLQ